MSYSYKYRRKNDAFWNTYSSDLSNSLSALDSTTLVTITTILTYLFVVSVGVYFLLRRTEVLPPNAFRKLVWRVFVYSIPPSLVLALERREGSTDTSTDPFEEENSYSSTRTFGAKSLAVKKILGMGTRFPNKTNTKSNGTTSYEKHKAQELPGLFNRDNECYQNSIIQGLASLPSFCNFIESLPIHDSLTDHAALTTALQAVLAGLNSQENHGRSLWTPWALKSMSSWQQQDAQEYYSRVIDEVEKDIKKTLTVESISDASLALTEVQLDNENNPLAKATRTRVVDDIFATSDQNKLRNPLEGLQAQRVGCLQCGYVEGLSLIQFNCITLSLGRQTHYDLEGLLSSYTDLETIPGVECARCTLLKQEKIIQRLVESRSENDSAHGALVAATNTRLSAVRTALQEQDFSEATLSKRCQITNKARVTTDKTKQSVIARPPHCLVIHINRSVFDERTGTQLKNYSQVQYPKLLNLDAWCLGTTAGNAIEHWETQPSLSMLDHNERHDDSDVDEKMPATEYPPRNLYTLRALITHYGTHGDGHYVSWRQDPQSVKTKTGSRTWWRLSDDDVVQFDEDTVLRQGGVFMLFYERISDDDDKQTESKAPNITEDGKVATSEDPDSPSTFLFPEIQASLNAKLEKYLTPKHTPETKPKPRPDLPVKVSTPNKPMTKLSSVMRTASEVQGLPMQSVGSIVA